IMTPQDNVSTDELDTLSQLLASTGALPLVISPEEHDEKVGAVSHLPHVAAAALVNTIYGLDDPNSLTSRLAAGGFKDITRIASSNPKMWAHISQINKDHLLPLVNKLIGELSSFKDRLKQDKPLALEDFFHRAKLSRDHIPTRENLYLLPFHELYVDVEDRPGMISLVTTILGDNQVNIKNIRIINSREDQPGCLLLSLNDAQSLKKAKNLLTEIGLKAYIR
ncbi:MAG TPA: prephenate dehydrogenase dimerization domain-containing protein, partial [Bacillota bacterium]|nr:prephenate dehydrogenase dimerization domain-containing protein [Bacillota bacterium]